MCRRIMFSVILGSQAFQVPRGLWIDNEWYTMEVTIPYTNTNIQASYYIQKSASLLIIMYTETLKKNQPY